MVPGANPARLIAMVAGLGSDTPAMTIDRGAASGLDAIILAKRAIVAGEAECVIAGGAEALSTAPWRVARPRGAHQLPRFLPPTSSQWDPAAPEEGIEAAEAIARRLGIGRAEQDAYVTRALLRIARAASERRLAGEITAVRTAAEEMRDESASHRRDDALDEAETLIDGGTLTGANTAEPADGAALAVIVSDAVHAHLGKPPALRVTDAVMTAGDPTQLPGAAHAVAHLKQRSAAALWKRLAGIEMSDTSALEAIVTARAAHIDEDLVNADGGALVRGHAHGAAGAILLARLFTQMIRAPATRRLPVAAAVSGTLDGLGSAALFEAIL